MFSSNERGMFLVPSTLPLSSKISGNGRKIFFFLIWKERAFWFLSLVSSFYNYVFHIFHVTKWPSCFLVLGQRTNPAHLQTNLESRSQMGIVSHFYKISHHCQHIHIWSSVDIVLQLKQTFSLCQCFPLWGERRDSTISLFCKDK